MAYYPYALEQQSRPLCSRATSNPSCMASATAAHLLHCRACKDGLRCTAGQWQNWYSLRAVFSLLCMPANHGQRLRLPKSDCQCVLRFRKSCSCNSPVCVQRALCACGALLSFPPTTGLGAAAGGHACVWTGPAPATIEGCALYI